MKKPNRVQKMFDWLNADNVKDSDNLEVLAAFRHFLFLVIFVASLLGGAILMFHFLDK